MPLDARPATKPAVRQDIRTEIKPDAESVAIPAAQLCAWNRLWDLLLAEPVLVDSGGQKEVDSRQV